MHPMYQAHAPPLGLLGLGLVTPAKGAVEPRPSRAASRWLLYLPSSTCLSSPAQEVGGKDPLSKGHAVPRPCPRGSKPGSHRGQAGGSIVLSRGGARVPWRARWRARAFLCFFFFSCFLSAVSSESLLSLLSVLLSRSRLFFFSFFSFFAFCGAGARRSWGHVAVRGSRRSWCKAG